MKNKEKIKFCACAVITALLLLQGCFEDVPPAPVAYKDVTATNFFKRTGRWVAGDVGFSIPLSNQQVLWLFGDSYIDNYDATTKTVPCLFQVHTAGLLQANKRDFINATTLLGTYPTDKSYFKNLGWSAQPEKQLWPGHGYQSGENIYVYLQGISVSNSINVLGEDYWAVIDRSTMEVTRYVKLPFMDKVFFGNALIKDEATGFVYAYGVKHDGGLGSNVYVARFSASNPFIDWQFWNGQCWDSNQANKKVIAQGRSYNVNISKVKNKFVLLTSDFSVGCDQGKAIYSQTATNLYGPFTNLQKIWTINDKNSQGKVMFNYYPIAHPEMDNNQDELLITYCVNGCGSATTDCSNGRRDPNTYRPRAIRVPYKLIDNSF